MPESHVLAAYRAALTVASELNPDAVLQRIVEVAKDVVSAKYAALGVADTNGRLLKFITAGISEADRAAIGPLPVGHGLLGELIHTGVPLLVDDISKDPRSSGFPPNHPPMKSLVGMPITLGDRILGNLYLTDRTDGKPFDETDLNAVAVLASHAASAIDRASLYRQIREQRDRLRDILEGLPSGVIIVSAGKSKVQFVNAAFIALTFGESAHPGALPMPGRDFDLLRADGLPLAPDDRPEARAAQGETVRNLQLTLRRTGAADLPVSVQSAPLRDESGAISEVLLVVQDVTRLRQAEQLKDDFLSLISHEFRTPLTAIHGGAQLLEQQAGALDDATRREVLTDIVAESDRLERMLNNLLSLAAVMAGRLSVETEPVLIGPLVKRGSTEVAARGTGHSFTSDIPAGTPAVEADASLLAQVLRNLYENAVKYDPTMGSITTRARADATTVTIDIIDQGAGIAPEHLDKVFERFHRAGADPTVRGMGLGLYLSRFLIEAQGGTLAVSSAGPGKGATFSVRLPIARGWIGDNERDETNAQAPHSRG